VASPKFGGWTPWASMFSGVADIFWVLGGPASDIRAAGRLVVAEPVVHGDCG
jgi:hypothetical protein